MNLDISFNHALRPNAAHRDSARPILITGARGTLGSAFVRTCTARGLPHHALNRQQLDITRPDSIARAIAELRPWAIINASGYVRVDDAEAERDACWSGNVHGPALLAAACAAADIHLLTFSSDLVFDGRQRSPYVESDPVRPLNVYGASKAEAERLVLAGHPQALVVRTSAFFGDHDAHNFVTLALGALAAGESFIAADDVTVTPTYVPDLVDACLDLLLARSTGLRHLSNSGEVTWAALAAKACAIAGVDAGRLEARPAESLGHAALRPHYCALASELPALLPTLDDALARYCRRLGAG